MMKRWMVALSFVFLSAVFCACPAAPRVALFDEAVPGQDRAANAALKAVLERRGYVVDCLDAAAFANLEKQHLAACVLPSCEAVPESVAAMALRLVHAGVPMVFLGGPLLDRKVEKRAGRWYTREMMDAALAQAPLGYRCPELGAAFKPETWRRSQSHGAAAGSFLRREGEELHLSVGPLAGWDVVFSPTGLRLFGEHETLFAFTARAEEPDTTISIELIERDGSRWIATATIGTAWTRHTLTREQFKYWQDSRTKGRGKAGDRVRPSEAHCIGFGVASTHTPSMAGRRADVHFRDIASCRDPFADAAPASALSLVGLAQDGVFPRYKFLVRDDAARAIFRPVGEGFGRGAFQRFKPLTAERGVAAEWILLERRPKMPARCLAGFGARNWNRPEILARVGAALDVMLKGNLLFEAGSGHFAYTPGETVKLGARWRGQSPTARMTVRNAQGTVLHQVDVASGVAVEWRPPAEPAVYTVETRLGDDVIVHEFAVVDPTPDPKADFISVSGGDFMLRGKKWYPVGINFWPLYVAGMAHKDYWAGWMRNEYYAPSLVEWDLAHFAEMGGNMISIQAPASGHERNLLDVLRRCRRHGIYVNLFLQQASPLGTQFVPRATPYETRPSELAEYLSAARLAGNATVFAYDTIWEPGNHVFRDDQARGRWDADWRRWIDENYGSVAAAEKVWGTKARRNKKGEVISPQGKWFIEDGAWRVQMAAYRRFMDNVTSRAWNRATRALRALAPHQLISFRQGNTLPYDFALTGPVRHIDFICPEGYSVPHTDVGEDAIGWLTRYVDATTGGKPIIWSEFGKSIWDGTRMESDPGIAETQGAYQERFYRTGLAAGANGTAPWWWTGGYRVGERSDYGIVSPDGTERPSARLLRDYAPKYHAARAKPVVDTWMVYDRDAHAGGYCRAAFHEGAAAWRAAVAEGQMLGIRLAGTDRTSVTAEGRHLDAEFDEFAMVCEGAEMRVTAVLGNVGTAAWAPAQIGKGGVWLVARAVTGEVLGKLPLAKVVPRLADSGALELRFKATDACVKVRLESEGRFAFGETRWIDGNEVRK